MPSVGLLDARRHGARAARRDGLWGRCRARAPRRTGERRQGRIEGPATCRSHSRRSPSPAMRSASWASASIRRSPRAPQGPPTTTPPGSRTAPDPGACSTGTAATACFRRRGVSGYCLSRRALRTPPRRHLVADAQSAVHSVRGQRFVACARALHTIPRSWQASVRGGRVGDRLRAVYVRCRVLSARRERLYRAAGVYQRRAWSHR